MMKTVIATLSLVAVTATPALANTSKAYIEDHYKTVIEQSPYKVEVCKDVQVPYGSNKEFDKESAIIGGLIGGLVGNQFGKGSGKEAATGVGALTGAIIGGNKDKGPAGYRTEQQCTTKTRYKEKERKVYSHSTVRFWHEGQRIELDFHK
jgi:uncharacterized protein YcfJ